MPLEDLCYANDIELLSEKRDLTIEQLAHHYRHLIYRNMMSTRNMKYKYFLWALRASKYVSCCPMRGTFLENYYVLMRYLDDIVDGDVPIPSGYGSASEYMERKITFARESLDPQDASEKLMEHCFHLGACFGEDFNSETVDILGSLYFDAKRRNPNEPQFIPQRDLQHHFHLLDIRGTINACLKLADEKEMMSEDLEPLGNASRIYYTLRDYDEDVSAGFVNVSQEDAARFGISVSDVRDSASQPVRAWILGQAQKGTELLREHRKRLPKLRMKRLIRAALWAVYERPANKYFLNVLSRHD